MVLDNLSGSCSQKALRMDLRILCQRINSTVSIKSCLLNSIPLFLTVSHNIHVYRSTHAHKHHEAIGNQKQVKILQAAREKRKSTCKSIKYVYYSRLFITVQEFWLLVYVWACIFNIVTDCCLYEGSPVHAKEEENLI